MEYKNNTSMLTKSEVLYGGIMMLSFVLAICIANIDLSAQHYIDFVFFSISIGYGEFSHQGTLINIVNDGLMTLFFLLIGLELKFYLVLGEYKNRRSLILPTAAAIGGVVIPALIYLFFNFNTPVAKGWAIPIATDTAFMLGILSFFSRNVSQGLRSFIVSFSLIDDALALLIMAIFYTKSLNLIALEIFLGILLLLIAFNRYGVKNSFWYLGVGMFLWISMVKAGIHGTLAGAVIALTIPVAINDKINSSFQTLENILRPLVYFFILPLFIFINSGVSFDNITKEMLVSNVSIGIILGLFIGKQLGVAGLSYLAVKMNWCSLPYNVHWLKFYAISILGGIGFTLSLFIGDLTFEGEETKYIVHTAVIIGSLLSGFIGSILFCYASRQVILGENNK